MDWDSMYHINIDEIFSDFGATKTHKQFISIIKGCTITSDYSHDHISRNNLVYIILMLLTVC